MMKMMLWPILFISFSLYGEASSSVLDDLLQIDYVRKAKDECEKEENPKLSECIWGKLDQKQKEEIQEKLADGEEHTYERKRLQEKTTAIARPELEALQSFFRKRLAESLFGDQERLNREGKIKVRDHNLYYDLFETQLGKNIITSYSEYCINTNLHTDTPNYCFIEDSTSDVRNNMKLLSKFDENKNSAAAQKFSNCVVAIPDICKTGSACDEQSKNRACIVVNYVTEAKQRLMDLEAIREGMKEREGPNALQAANIEYYQKGQGQDEKGVNRLTSLTTKEIQDSDYSTTLKEQQKKVQECLDSGTSQARCEGLLLAGEEKENLKNNDLNTALRMEAQAQRYAGLLENDEEETKEKRVRFLEEAGLTQEEIDKMGDEAIKTKVQELTERYKEEKDAVIAGLNDKLKKTTSKNETISGEDSNDIEELGKNLQQDEESLLSLSFFTNAISSLITEDEEIGGMIPSPELLREELANSGYLYENDRFREGDFKDLEDNLPNDRAPSNENIDRATLTGPSKFFGNDESH